MGESSAIRRGTTTTHRAVRLGVILAVRNQQRQMSLQRFLQGIQLPWQIESTESDVSLWKRIEQGHVHLIVVDAPPTFRGSMLEQIAERVPHIVRLVLCTSLGQAQEFVQAGWAHEALGPDVPPHHMMREIARAAGVAGLLADSLLAGLLAPLQELPANASALQATWVELRAQEPRLERLAQSVSQDAALVARILKLANSPLFAPSTVVTSLRQALILVGLGRLRALIIYLNCFSRIDPALAQACGCEAWQGHSTAIAQLALAIALREGLGPQEREQLLLAGLLQDVGQLALLAVEPERYQTVLSPHPPVQRGREHDAFSVTHAEAGAFLLGLWHLPLAVTEGVRAHHRREHLLRGMRDLGSWLVIANILYEERQSGVALSAAELEPLGFTHEHLTAWRAIARDL